MASARRKTTEEHTVRSPAGTRLAREQMVSVAGAVFANGNANPSYVWEAESQNDVRCLVLPCRKSGSVSAFEFAPDWLTATTPETELRFLTPGHEPGRPKAASNALALSALAHAALLAIALVAFPKASEFPAGGEAAIPVEMVFIAPDATDAPATESGAKQETAEISVALPPQVTDAVTVPLPEVSVAMPDTALPVQIDVVEVPVAVIQMPPLEAAPPALIETPVEKSETPEPLAPAVQPQEQLPYAAPVARDGILPKSLEPVIAPVLPKLRPTVDQGRIQRNALVAQEARRQARLQEAQEEQREEQRQAQIIERQKQQTQRAALDVQRRATTEAKRQQSAVAREATSGRGEGGAGAAQVTRQARQAGGGTKGAIATPGATEITSYRARILAHLARHKNYPESAQDAGVQGRATVSFTITRAGGVTSASLAGSSGAGVLDQATLAMVRRAQPFPAMPVGGPASMSFTAVIRYDLR